MNADGVPGPRGSRPAVTLEHSVGYRFQTAIWFATSGVGWDQGIEFCNQVMGEDRVLHAMDYPYQQSSDEFAANDAMDMSAKTKKKLMQTNAEGVFRL